MNVYDFDGTIFNGDSTIEFWKFCVKRKPIILCKLFQFVCYVLKYKLGLCSKELMKEKFYSFLVYFDNIEEVVKLFWEENRYRIKKWYLEQKKDTDVIISASPDFLLKPICLDLQVSLISSMVDENTGKLLSKNCHGKEKVSRFKNEFPNELINEFYSDSDSDIYMAKLAKKAFVVKRNKVFGWKIN